VIGTSKGLYVSSINSAGELASVRAVPAFTTSSTRKITSLARGASGRLYAAAAQEGVFTISAETLRTNPETPWEIIPGSQGRAANKATIKLATSTDPASGEDVLYMGTGVFTPNQYGNYLGYDYIHRWLDNKNQYAPLNWQTADVFGKIGNGQVPFHSSFAADPTTSNRVFAGGNYMLSGWQAFPIFSTTNGTWNPAIPDTYTGGVVGTIFEGRDTQFENHFPTSEQQNAAGTAPHADSRDITFLTTRSGTTRIIEADDGGFYIKDLSLDAPWQSINDGLRTTESFASDWSHIGKLAITAMQDNAVALGKYRADSKDFYNLTGGDGAIALFDDGILGSDNQSHAYYTGQQYYFGNALIQASTYTEQGILKDTDFLSLDIADKYGNFQSFKDYDIGWSELGPNYYFYYPAETNDYRAGDLIISGVRNLYEAIIPHWQLPTAGNAKFVPLLNEDLLSEDDKYKIKKFTEIALGSNQSSKFARNKPYSWDTLLHQFYH